MSNDILGRIAREIQDERHRQVERGLFGGSQYLHNIGVLARAGAAYSLMAGTRDWTRGRQCGLASPPIWFPWERSMWRPISPRTDLVRASAMLMGEIELLDQSSAREGETYV